MPHLNPGRRRAFTRRCAFEELYFMSAEWAILPLHCKLFNGCHTGGANLIKTTGAKHCWWIEEFLFTLLDGAAGRKKTKLINLVNTGKQISVPGLAFNLISMLITNLGLWNCVHVCEWERLKEKFLLQSLQANVIRCACNEGDDTS